MSKNALKRKSKLLAGHGIESTLAQGGYGEGEGQQDRNSAQHVHCSILFSSLPVVVPSPATMSCDLDSSTSILAAG